MEDTLICFVCNKSDGKIILFSEETLRKCRTVLKIRKKYNLKYKDIILPDEYIGNGYHRECYKAFTGVMKKYLTSKPVNSTKNSEKQKSVSVSAYNSSPTPPLIPELTAEPSCLQFLTTESSITSQSSLISNSIESKPTTFQGNHHLKNLPTESSSILQPSLIFDSIKLQSTTSQENIEIFEPDVSDNNDSTEDANILNENDASTNNYQIVCVFCNREHKKLHSKMLPLHKADTNQFKSSVLPNIEGQEEYVELLNKLKNFSGPKISYHTE
ncbi:hypothetical protein TNCT_59021 [Trichonephila clavata]|uniref:Uncharacterized protein n=1 Tax=Trichonephila clavata TaxID=2740835 RepID=A0A8X6I840_TRICU|nr:hypothetical protein TNCT_59021 [Trichonephila clavata]